MNTRRIVRAAGKFTAQACARAFANAYATAALVALLAGCAAQPPATTPSAPSQPAKPAPSAPAPPPPVNLQGFPPAYQAGFGDGCATARGSERKDADRFGKDGNYRVGWQDGVAQCKTR
ncbi:MAG: hypothetical protein U1F54_02665 [Burkholderiales bacterium]